MYLLYDDVIKYYSVISNVAGCFAMRYICQGCNKGCKRGELHNCDATCSDCLAVPPCEYGQVRRPCNDCNLCFRSDTCFENFKTQVISGKMVCEHKCICNICKTPVCNKHECFKLTVATVRSIANPATSVKWPCCPSRCHRAPMYSMFCII